MERHPRRLVEPQRSTHTAADAVIIVTGSAVATFVVLTLCVLAFGV